ncbi:MAG: VOC family protein [Phycisphaerales bacterium]|nr:VOC family protein [Phycisphaerales bacterium]
MRPNADFELDHVFVLADRGGDAAAAALRRAGLIEGTPNTHPGQGTACRRFFVGSRYIELLWVIDAGEVQGPLVFPTRLGDRWNARASGACPFGLVFRSRADPPAPPPFPSFEYRPPYLPAGLVLHVATSADRVDEPLLIYLPVNRNPAAVSTGHQAGPREITSVQLAGPWRDQSPASLRIAADLAGVRVRDASEFSLAIGFDDEPEAREIDLRPALPVALRF